MSILYGKLHRTAIQLYGGLGRPLGRLSYLFMTSLEFTLQLAGPAGAVGFEPKTFQTTQKGDTGVDLVVEVVDRDGDAVNVRPATSTKILLRKPDGTTEEKDAAVLTNGTDGKLHYTTVEDDLDQAGIYQIQAKITFPSSIEQATRIGTFEVLENVPPPPEP